ncbi:tetraprenyl-beta-curcumene synthase family protein [Pontibacillus litoralis]|uniref:Tetraprenyl-beta-curcumene synthase n=1 Tax=Pontibacillus litoralis JSM 072002 TaxID=1385512 RepID=A0A0A5G3Y3_9BACI|nr:tetraprenyl-beta-curcumene synthase family protein [Pontibacillus litoralis]KGX86764.1 hypothetical protein N784_03985 [Pontibacillus litoralis JSM 072002]
MSVPSTPIHLMATIYRRIFPNTNRELAKWRKQAEAIPNEELRSQALNSIDTKTFHCEGGSIYSLLAHDNWRKATSFIVAYQTISDYLDNLCDRSTSLDPDDFRCLHQAMLDALTPGAALHDYYALREDKDDGGYLNRLVQTCQQSLAQLEQYDIIQPYTHELASLYCDLQVHKHVQLEERVPRLEKWFDEYANKWSDLTWYEFSACAGSTLGVFCLVSYCFGPQMTSQLADQVLRSYFPYMQGLHILLDYYIDQQEDLEEGDLNFCSYYEHEGHMKERFLYFINQTKQHVKALPHASFHHMVQKGLVGLYLADSKVQSLHGADDMVKALLNVSGLKSKFFYVNSKLYHKIKPGLA